MSATRRDFFRTLALGVAGFAVLPSALTYKRTWKVVSGLVVPVEVPIVMNGQVLGYTIRQLFSEQKQEHTYALSQYLERYMKERLTPHEIAGFTVYGCLPEDEWQRVVVPKEKSWA